MTVTPAIRDFLDRVDDLLDARAPAGLDRERVTATPGPRATLVHLPHRSDPTRDVELEVDDRDVLVRYRPEEIRFTSREEALRFLEMLCDGRVMLEVRRNPLFTTMESFRDRQTIPFRRTRMPWPTLRPRVEHLHPGFAD